MKETVSKKERKKERKKEIDCYKKIEERKRHMWNKLIQRKKKTDCIEVS